jgi:hypothetical protein
MSIVKIQYYQLKLLKIYRAYTKEWCGLKSEYKIYVSHYTGTTYTFSGGNCPSFSRATSSSLLMLTAWPVSKMAWIDVLLQMETRTFSLGHPVRQILHRAISFFGVR